VGDWIDDRIQRGREAIGDEIVFDIIMNVGLAVDEVQIVPGVVEERWQRKVTRRSGDEAVGIAADFLNERRPGNGKWIFIQKSDCRPIRPQSGGAVRANRGGDIGRKERVLICDRLELHE